MKRTPPNAKHEWQPGVDMNMILNPHATLKAEYANQSPVGVYVIAPIKGGQLTTTAFPLHEQTLLAKFLLGLLEGTPNLEPELGEEDLQQLVAAGLLVENDNIPIYPAFCFPLRSRDGDELAAPHGDELVHPGLRTFSSAERPTVFAGGSAILVPSIATGVSLPYWVEESLLELLIPGAQATLKLSEEQRAALRAAGVIVTQTQLAKHDATFAALGTELREAFQRTGYFVMKRLLPHAYAISLAEYYRTLIAEGFLQFKDRISEHAYTKRWVKPQDALATWLHQRLCALVCEIAGTRVKPSYCFVSAYEPGAELLRHVDRPQCEYSISLQLGYEPDQSLASQWPIYLDTPQASSVPVRLDVADALVYRGRQLPHYRRPLSEGHRSLHIFFHFVDWSFADSLD